MSTAPYIREPTPAFSSNSWTQGEFRSSGITKERAPLYERLPLSGGLIPLPSLSTSCPSNHLLESDLLCGKGLPAPSLGACTFLPDLWPESILILENRRLGDLNPHAASPQLSPGHCA